MKKNKKILTFMLAASFCAVQFAYPMSMTGFAAEQTIYTGTCGAEGDNITWTYDASTQTMTFSGSGAMNDFWEDEKAPWMDGELSEIYNAKVVIYEEGITNLGGVISADVIGKNLSHCDIVIPESAVDYYDFITLSPECSITYHVKYGSTFYYKLNCIRDIEGRYNCNIVAEGVAENEVIPTEGETEQGLRWNFDYETDTLTLGGTDGQVELNLESEDNWKLIWNDSFHGENSVIGKMWHAAETIVIEKDFIVPEDPEELQSITELSAENAAYEMFKYAYLNYIIYFLGYKDNKTIYCYKDSAFEQEYEAYVAYYAEEMPWMVYSGNNVVCLDDVVEVGSNDAVSFGDLNMDGNVDLRDAVYMNKHTANIVQLTDAQKAIADCDCDGSVTDADVTTLMEYLMFQIPSLPYQA